MNVPASEDYRGKYIKYARFGRYVVSGLMSKIVGLIVLELLVRIQIFPVYAAMTSFISSVIIVFLLNAQWVFETSITLGRMMRAGFVVIVTFLLFTSLFAFFHFIGITHLLASILASIHVYPVHYVLNHSFVYSKKKE